MTCMNSTIICYHNRWKRHFLTALVCNCWMTKQETLLLAFLANGLMIWCSLTSHGWRSWTLAAPLQGTPVSSHSPAGDQQAKKSLPSTSTSVLLSSSGSPSTCISQLCDLWVENIFFLISFFSSSSLLFLNKSWIVCEPSSNWMFGPRQK